MHPIYDLICEDVRLDDKTDRALTRMYEHLFEFTKEFYCVENFQWFQDCVLFSKLPGFLIQYSIHGMVVGFTRLAYRCFNFNGEDYTVYFGGTYHDPAIQLNLSAARASLLRALQYKLFHPKEKLVYFANAYHPQRYAFIRELSQTIEPCPNGQVSSSVVALMEQLSLLNDWQVDENNPLLIKRLMPLKPIWQAEYDVDMGQFLRLNPEYMKGDSLYMYLPLDMATLGRCLNRSIADGCLFGRLAEQA